MSLTNLVTQKQMQFAPVENDGDELVASIESDQATQDDQWNLHDGVDATQIEAFLDDALQELGAEPIEQD